MRDKSSISQETKYYSHQKIIDRRFYRNIYDAARVLAKYSTILYDDVDPNILTAPTILQVLRQQ